MARGLRVREAFRLVDVVRDRENRRELWRHYMGNAVTIQAGKDAKTYADVLEDYESARHPVTAKQVQEAHSTAQGVLEALQKARGEG